MKPDDPNGRFRRSAELFEFYRCLAGLQAVLIRYVQSAKTFEDKVLRAQEVMKDCEQLMMRYSESPCPAGQTWDEATGTCQGFSSE